MIAEDDTLLRAALVRSLAAAPPGPEGLVTCKDGDSDNLLGLGLATSPQRTGRVCRTQGVIFPSKRSRRRIEHGITLEKNIMHLADFILGNFNPILQERDAFSAGRQHA